MDKKGQKAPLPTEEALKKATVLQTQSRRSESDVLGSYTGTAANGDLPEQDVDDL